MQIPTELLRLLKTGSPKTKQVIFDWLKQLGWSERLIVALSAPEHK